jgi:8-oxo-dGTP pyrophosphatase MutT (NUDIX family)
VKSKLANLIVHARRLACENSRFELFFDDIEWAGRERVSNYLVVAPRVAAAGLVTGVAVLPVVEGKFALIRMYRHAVRDHVWEVPRGFMDGDESPVAAAVRELQEETGLSCQEADMRSLGMIAPEAGILAGRIRLYAALNCVAARPFDAGELGHHEMRLFDAAELAAMAANSEVQDPGTLVAYYRLLALSGPGRAFN